MNKASQKQKAVVVCALGTTQTLAFCSTYYLPAILADPISISLGISSMWFFGIFSGALLLSGLVGPSAGHMIDQYGGRNALILSNGLCAVGLLVLALSSGLIGLASAWAILGLGMAFGLYETAFSILIGLYGHKAHSAIPGITLIAGFASTIGWPFTIYLSEHFGWREACLTWSALHLLVGLPLNCLLIPSAPTPFLQSKSPLTAKIQSRVLMILGSTFAATAFISAALTTHLPRLLHDFGVSSTAAIIIAALLGPAQVGSRLGMFMFSKRISAITSAQVAVLLHPIGGACLFLVGEPIAAAFVILHGVGNGMLTIARGTVPLELFGVVSYGLQTGLIAFPVRLAQAAAPFVFGLVLAHGGSTIALSFSAALSIISFIFLTRLQANYKALSKDST